MAYRIPQEELDRLKSAVSLERLCKDYGIDLKPRGKDLVAHCPFHDDKDPSFNVTPSKNLWNCLGGCGGGDNIQLVMRWEKVSFRRAIERLKDILGETPAALVVKVPRGKEHSVLVDHEVNDEELLKHVTEYYHRSFMNDPKAMQYLQKRKCLHPEAITKFKLGYSNRTLAYRIPYNANKLGAGLRAQLQRIGIYRASGREHLVGSVVVPIFDHHGQVAQLYGRKVMRQTREAPDHLYLSKSLRGVWNWESLIHQKEWLVCEAPLDALTFWCHGFRNVTCSYGTNNFTADHWALLEKYRPERIVICYDNDRAGNEAAAKLAEELAVKGFTVLRAKPPLDRDVNDLACESQEPQAALASMLERAEVVFSSRERVSIPLIEAAPLLAAETAAKKEMMDESVKPSSEIENDKSEEAAPAAAKKEEEIKPLANGVVSTKTEFDSDWESDTHTMRWGQREWRLRGVSKNLSYEILKVQLRVKFGSSTIPGAIDPFFSDTLDLQNAKHRQNFILQAHAETQLSVEVLKRDIGQVLLAAEALQEKIIKQTLEPKEKKAVVLTQEEREEALALLRDPKLSERTLEDYERCGVTGETINKLVGYLAAVSRKMDDPLAVIIQSTSAAGKSALMEAILAFVPEEERVKYSAMTGQSLYYLGETNLKHKILAIVEEAGAEKASYPLKLLQSEGELIIASTGKDPNTGRMVTHEYRLEGPSQILLTTTAIEIDEELLNRFLVLTVDESREQTRRIHQLQRESETLEGLLQKLDKQKILLLHRNAQRLLRPLRVVNPYAKKLTFLDDRTRTRRDHMKYLALIRARTLWYQYQRPIKTATPAKGGQAGVEYIEVTLEDIAAVNQIAGEVLGRSLDELPPQTRRLLMLLHEMIAEECKKREIAREDYRFSRREVRQRLGWSDTALKVHLQRLVEMEYLLIHRAQRGQGYVYEMFYAGEGQDGGKFVMGLLDMSKFQNIDLSLTYDADWSGQNDDRSGQNGQLSAPGQPPVRGWSGGGQGTQNGHFPSENGEKHSQNGENARPGEKKEDENRSRNPSSNHEKEKN